MEIISRREAFTQGRTRFYTGRPCKHGHDCERYTSTKGCVKCVNGKTTSWKILRASPIPERSPRAQPIIVEIPYGVTLDQAAEFAKWVQHVAAPHYFRTALGIEYGPPKSKVEGT